MARKPKADAEAKAPAPARKAKAAAKPKRKPPAKPRVRSRSNKPGRPSKCTPAVIEAVEKLVRNGIGRQTAAQQAGIGICTHHVWMARGAAGEEPYGEYMRRIEAASAANAVEIGEVLTYRGLRSLDDRLAVETAKWLGERLHPEQYGRSQQVRLEGPAGGPVQVEHSGAVDVRPSLSPERLAELPTEQLEAALEAARRGEQPVLATSDDNTNEGGEG